MTVRTSIRRFIHKRRLYPTSRLDRILLWFSIPIIVVFVLRIATSTTGRSLSELRWPDGVVLVLSVLIMWTFLYVVQDAPEDEFGDYTAAISNIESISKQLSELSDFLKQERQKIAESEATLYKLKTEKTELEPVVNAQRETVEAILSAHAKATGSRAGKERMLGFVTGLIASLLASIVFEYFRL